MRRRTGITLIEVLVAIFIMAIGLMALLTLFPIGMLRIAQAIRDARSAESVVNAHSISIMQNVRNDPMVISDGVPLFPDLFVNPGAVNLAGQKILPDADPYGESYPIFVDPIGYFASPAGNTRDWVGGPAVLRRRPTSICFTPAFAVNQTAVYQNFTLWDDMSFDPQNVPGTPQMAGLNVLRDPRYSWAYLLRRPQAGDRTIVDCTIVIFDQRSQSLNANLSLEEFVYTGITASGAPGAFFSPANNTITIDATNNVPPGLKPGDWVLDATFYQKVNNGPGAANAYFYRVVAVEDLGSNQTRYEVQTPLRGYLASPSAVGTTFNPSVTAAGYAGTAVVIRGIAEVFDKGPARLP